MASIHPRARTIAEVKANLLNPAQTSQFQVNIGVPQGREFNSFLNQNDTTYRQDQLNLLCSEASLPGSQLATTEMTGDFTGVTERHAYRRMYDDRIDLTFYCDADQYLPIRFFESWIRFIMNENDEENFTGSTKKRNFFYRASFPNDYKGSLEVTKFEKNINSRRKVKPLSYGFVNCFPLAINSMPVSYDASDLLKCTVSMTYSRYYLDKTRGGLFDMFDPRTQADLNGQAFQALNAGLRALDLDDTLVGGVARSFASNLI